MGWPNTDPEGWAEVERAAVTAWLAREFRTWDRRTDSLCVKILDMISMLQAEHPEMFRALVNAAGEFALTDVAADYLERKFSTGAGL